MKREKRTFYPLEISLMLALVAALLVGTWLSGQQRALADRVVRLHVIGASDTEEDQRAKLRARDAVLDAATPWLKGAESREEAMAALALHLEELAAAGAQAAGADARASLEENVWFPTKVYDDFALPAGRYPALRISLGEGKGRNWWCVVFPPLCMGSVTESASQAGSFSQDQLSLITGESETYVVRFRALELWDRLVEGWSR